MNPQSHPARFLSSVRKNKQPSAAKHSVLNVESLEERMMLSSVSITAVGQEGGEIMQVYANDQLILEGTMTESAQEFSVETEDFVGADQIRIEFTNDEYRPQNDFDRNLTILSFEVDGETIEFGDQMFSTGTYTNSTGIQDGFGRGNTLHTDGYFQYRPDVSNSFTFQDRVWTISGDPNRVTGENSQVALDGRSGPVSISTEFDVVGNALFRLTADAYRDTIGFFDRAGQPWSTIGVNFYDASGDEIGQERFDINGRHQDPATSISKDFIVPDDATSAYVWAWIGFGPNVPLVINQITLEPIDLSGDTTPPELSMQSFTLTEPTGEEVNFGVVFTDDIRLGDPDPAPFLVTGPNGFSELAGVRTGLPSTDTEETLIYGLTKPDGSDWGPQDNGTYTVELLPGAVTDQAGNEAEAGVIGTFELAIVLPPADTEAPQISIGPTPDITEFLADPYQFSVYTTDNRSPFPFANGISVFGPDGNEVNSRGIAGGFDTPNNRNWELYYIFPSSGSSWTSADNGEYQIVLDEGGLVDSSGNVTPAQLLASFVVNIEDVIG